MQAYAGKGVIIDLEGIDGSGKMTQSDLLNKFLRGKEKQTALYSYPDYESSYGKIIRDEFLYGKRKFPIEELFLLYLAGIVKDKDRIINDLKDGKFVIMDRFYLSTIAYQTTGGFDYNDAKRITEMVHLPAPNFAFYIDIDPEVSFVRKNKQKANNPDKFEKDIAYLNKVRDMYKEMIADGYPPKTKWVQIDGTKSIEEIHRIILDTLRID